MRRFPATKKFKGSVFVEFPSEADAQKASAETLTYGETSLIVKMKEQYFADKLAEAEAVKAKSFAHRSSQTNH
jgi:hypothetical protein